MKDMIAQAMDTNGQIRVFAANTSQLVAHAGRIHHTSPTATAALGRLLTGAALMACTLKNPSDTMTLQIRGSGPIGGMTAVTDAMSGVRGFCNHPIVDIPLNEKGKFDVAGAIGAGTLAVIKDVGLKEPWSGQVELISGEIAEDLTWYYAKSEQTPTVMTLGVLVGAGGQVQTAGGLFVQVLPDTPDSVIDELEARVAELPPMTTMLAHGESLEQIIERVLGVDGTTGIVFRSTQYRCNCSRERMERNLISLGRRELSELCEDANGIELHCHFCNERYHFSQTETRTLFDRATMP